MGTLKAGLSDTIRRVNLGSVREYQKKMRDVYSSWEVESAARAICARYDYIFATTIRADLTVHDVGETVVHAIGATTEYFIEIYYIYEEGADDKHPIIKVYPFEREIRA